jgi:MFS family permease
MTIVSEPSARPDARGGLRSLPRNVWAVTAASFLNDVSSDMILNLLPLFLANALGVRTAVIGLIEGLAESLASLLKICSGWLSDRLGSRKGMTVLGYALSTVAKPCLALATSWAGVLAVRLADRTGKGIRAAPRDALIADSVDERRRGLAFGLHRAGDTAGAMTGILIAAGVVWAMQAAAPTLAARTFRTLALISALPAAAAVLVLILAARDVPPAGVRGAPRLTLAGLDARFRRFLLVVTLFTLGNSADAFVILRAQERGLSVIGVLLMLATFNLIYALASGPAGALSDRVGRRRLIVAGWGIYGLLYLGFALSRAAWHVWALYALYGLYYAAFEGTARAYVADLVDPARRGTAYGAYNAAVGLAALPASLIAGLLWQGIGGWGGFGPGAPFAFGAALALIATLLLVAWVRTPREASGRVHELHEFHE